MNPLDFVKKEPYKLYIDGKWVKSKSQKTFDMINPATDEVFASAYQGGKEDVDLAIEAARRAFDQGPWKKMSHLGRSQLLYKAMELLRERQEEFASLETLDCGKLYPSVLYYEMGQALDGFTYSAGKARHLEGKVIPVDGGGENFNYMTWEPCGVVAEILPWNGPLMMGSQKIPAILAAGNTVIVKPSSWASLSMLAMAEIFHEAGFPPGVFNVVTGPGSLVGDALVASEEVDMVSMTGGTDTGKSIMEKAASTVKKIALELGGKSPHIIFDDVDLDDAARWAVFGFTLNSGQVCVSGTRILVEETIYEELLAKMKAVCQAFKPGDGFKFTEGVNFSSLISKEHVASVRAYIEAGLSEGGRLVCGGLKFEDTALPSDNFVPPTIFADVTPDMPIYQEEIFGPVACVTPFKTEEEAIRLANQTKYGLAGGVFCKSLAKAHRVAQQIKSGQIYINSYFSKGMMESPGTGWKQSGIGVAGIHKYMHSRTIFLSLEDHPQAPL